MDFQEISWECLDWIEQAKYRDIWRALVNTMMNIQVS